MLVLAPPTDSARIKLVISLSVINFLGLLAEVAVEKPANYRDLLLMSNSCILIRPV